MPVALELWLFGVALGASVFGAGTSTCILPWAQVSSR